MTIDNVSIELRIKHARQVKNLSQEELAFEIDSSRSAIAMIELGQREASLSMLVDIANALEVSSDELLVDNLEVTSSSNDSDIHYLLLDCSKEEQQFITKVIKSLRNILRTYSLKQTLILFHIIS